MFIPVLYGSQTGNGIHLGNLLKERIPILKLIELNSFDLIHINSFPLIIFVVSSHGYGSCPFNMSKFYNLICTENQKIFSFDFCLLGLGDSSYSKYNECAKITVSQITKLGGNLIHYELANTQDENGSYDGFERFARFLEDYVKADEFKSKFEAFNNINAIRLQNKLSNTQENQEDILNNMNAIRMQNKLLNTQEYQEDILNNMNAIRMQNKLLNTQEYQEDILNNMNPIRMQNKLSNTQENQENMFIIAKKKYQAKVLENKLITPIEYSNRIYEIIFDIPDYDNFYPGDCLTIFPKSTLDLSNIFNFESHLLDNLKKNVDFFGRIRQLTFKDLAKYCDNEIYKKKLIDISTNYDLYHDYVVVPKRNIIEIIKDFNLDLPYDFLIRALPILPRYYSIAKIDGKYHIYYNEIRYKTYLKTERLGLCSEYLKTLKPQEDKDQPSKVDELSKIEVEIVSSNLFLEEEKILFFSTGTGITVPRSVLHYFNNKTIRIYYGFRHYNVDELCKGEFKNVEVFYASSKDDKKHIMDVYRENPVDNIDEWLIIASGNYRINKEIKSLLKDVHGKDVVFQSETW